MAQNLTPKQEAFCLAYIETGNASEAYRRAYDASRTKPECVNVNASKLLASAKISLRVDELKAEHAARHEITVETIRDMLLQDRDFARDLDTPAAAISATMGLAKLYGHLTDKLDANIKGQIGLPDIHLGERPAE